MSLVGLICNILFFVLFGIYVLLIWRRKILFRCGHECFDKKHCPVLKMLEEHSAKKEAEGAENTVPDRDN